MTTSNYPKILDKMNACLYGFLHYFESVMHTATPKSEGQKTRRKPKEAAYPFQASPDCLNMRASFRKTDNVRRNPAP